MWKLLSVPILLVGLLGTVAMRADGTVPTAVAAVSAEADTGRGDGARLEESLRRKLRQEDEGSAFWRGKRPRICAVSECPSAEPIYCLVKKGLRVEAVLPGRDSCDRGLGVRDATERTE